MERMKNSARQWRLSNSYCDHSSLLIRTLVFSQRRQHWILGVDQRPADGLESFDVWPLQVVWVVHDSAPARLVATNNNTAVVFLGTHRGQLHSSNHFKLFCTVFIILYFPVPVVLKVCVSVLLLSSSSLFSNIYLFCLYNHNSSLNSFITSDWTYLPHSTF